MFEKKKEETYSGASYIAEYYLVEIGIAIIFIITAFLFGQKVDTLDFLVVIILFIVLPFIIYLLIKIVNIVLQYLKKIIKKN